MIRPARTNGLSCSSRSSRPAAARLAESPGLLRLMSPILLVCPPRRAAAYLATGLAGTIAFAGGTL